jgi:hypothetical protein
MKEKGEKDKRQKDKKDKDKVEKEGQEIKKKRRVKGKERNRGEVKIKE